MKYRRQGWREFCRQQKHQRHRTRIPKAWMLACIVQFGQLVVVHKEELRNKGDKVVSLFTGVIIAILNYYCFLWQSINLHMWWISSPKLFFRIIWLFCPSSLNINFKMRVSDTVKITTWDFDQNCITELIRFIWGEFLFLGFPIQKYSTSPFS